VIRHLTPADYTTMPWANGRGQTVELIRQNAPDGGLLWRLSMASVVEDGPFSIFPGVERNLTVISGPGFDLVGQTRITAAPLMPVAFPGDVPIAAAGVTTPSDDFNVMTARALPLPDVQVLRGGDIVPPKAGFLAIFALEIAKVSGRVVGKHDLIITDEKAQIEGGLCIAVGLSL
jgi:uncharacterized protein